MIRAPRLPVCASLLLCAIAWSQPAPDAAKALPPGPGHDIAAAKCVSCHDATRLESPGYNRKGWQRVVSQMMRIGATLTPGQVPVLTGYLVRSFPVKPRPEALLLRGSVQVSFREWAVGTPGAFPHDPLAASDGALWYTGQHASVLGSSAANRADSWSSGLSCSDIHTPELSKRPSTSKNVTCRPAASSQETGLAFKNQMRLPSLHARQTTLSTWCVWDCSTRGSSSRERIRRASCGTYARLRTNASSRTPKSIWRQIASSLALM